MQALFFGKLKMADDDYEFEAFSETTSVSSVSSSNANGSGRYSVMSRRTKAQRRKLSERAKLTAANELLHKEQIRQAAEEEKQWNEANHTEIVTKAVQFSFRQKKETSKTPRRRRRLRRRNDWKIEEDDCNHVDSSLDDETLTPDSHARSSINSISSSSSTPSSILKNGSAIKRVHGAGGNGLAGQDAGSCRMVYDQCTYLASTILSSHNATEAACELALILSDKGNRSVLLATPADALGNVLQTILDVFAEIPPPIKCQLTLFQGKQHDGENDDFFQEPQSQDSSASFVNTQEDDHSFSQEHSYSSAEGTGNDNKRKRTRSSRKRPRKDRMRGVKSLDAAGIEALAAAVHFLSLDCTVAHQSASNSAAVARRVRRVILEHGKALRGIARLAWDDQCVRNCLPRETTSQIVESRRDPAVSPVKAQDEMRFDDGEGEADPTLLGRRKRRKERRKEYGNQPTEIHKDADETAASLPSKIGIDIETDDLSFVSRVDRGEKEENPSAERHGNVADMLLKLRAATQVCLERDIGQVKDCSGSSSGAFDPYRPNSNSSRMALHSLVRIVQGKHKDETSCLDAEGDGDNQTSTTSNGDSDTDSNPLIATNRLLLDSGVLPILATSMAETLGALLASKGLGGQSMSYVEERLTSLAALIDGAACLSAANREAITEDCVLVFGVLCVLRLFTSDLKSGSPTSLIDIALTLARTLTSLTHENATAGKQLLEAYSPSEATLGIETLMELLYEVVAAQGHSKDAKTSQNLYDIAIFCLNTMTNMINTPGASGIVATYQIRSIQPSSSFLTWMTRWLVSETTAFREGLLHGTFGEKSESQVQRELSDDLDDEAREHLVTAGNGFIFLSCLMTSPQTGADQQIQELSRKRILQELPVGGDERRNGVSFVKNTLRAFCNFYHYSVGAMSVAIIAPVKELIDRLDEIG